MPNWIWLIFLALLAMFAWPSIEGRVLKGLKRWRRRRRADSHTS